MKFPRPATLHIVLPIGQTLALAVLIVALIATAAEGIARLPAVESHLPAPSIGSSHEQFEVQLYLLEKYAAADPIDCFFLGSSMVWRGIDPARFADAYAAQTGESLRCFVLGVNALTASGAAILAGYVVNTYHPRLLIYGVSPRDFNRAVTVQGFAARQFNTLDWLRYRRGTFNVTGWLFDHSAAFGYAYFYRAWMLPDFPEQVQSRRERENSTHADGYSPYWETLTWPVSGHEKQRMNLIYRQYTPVLDELDAVRQIVALRGQTQVILVEVPQHEDVITKLIGSEAYALFNSQIDEITTPARVLYWPTTLLGLIPDEGWYNLNHLNDTGAQIFSRWLGEQVGAAANAGELAR